MASVVAMALTVEAVALLSFHRPSVMLRLLTEHCGARLVMQFQQSFARSLTKGTGFSLYSLRT